MKNDIRISRKIGPLCSAQCSTNYGTRSSKFRKSASFVPHPTTKETSVTKQGGIRIGRPIQPRIDKNQKPRNFDAIVDANVVSKNSDKDMHADRKRRRPSTQSYINKRFLYDVAEPTRRTRPEGTLQSRARSTAELMAVSSANLLRRSKSRPVSGLFVDGTLKSCTTRGRSVKRPLNADSVNDVADDLVYSGHLRSRKNIRRIDHKTTNLQGTNTQVNWDAHDLFSESTAHDISEYRLSDTQPISSLQKALMDEDDDTILRMRGISATPRSSASPRTDSASYRLSSDMDLIVRSRHQTCSRSHLDPTGGAYLSHGQTIYPHQRHHSSPTLNPSADILASLYSDVHPGCFSLEPHHVHVSERHRHLADDRPDDADDELDDVLSSPDYLVSARRSHNRYPTSSGHDISHAAVVHNGTASEAAGAASVSEELEEEEDLLSPELSILAGTTVGGNVVGAPGELMAGADCDSGRTAIFIPQGVSSSTLGSGTSSRRKSPVRPMQVIRTKSHTTPATTSSQQSPPVAGGGGQLETSSLILTSSVLHGGTSAFSHRRLSGENDYLCAGDSSRDLNLHQQELTTRGGGNGASVIRLLPGHPPVVQAFPATTGSSAVSTRQLISTSGAHLQGTTHSPEAHPAQITDDAGAGGGLIISVATPVTTARPTSSYLPNVTHSSSRLLISSGGIGVPRPPATVSAPNPSSTAPCTSVSRTSLLATSASPPSSAVAARRRPTILKRVPPVANGGSGLLRPSAAADSMDSPAVHQPLAAPPDQQHHQSAGSCPSTTTSAVSALTISSVSCAAAPTKLLQLVTAPLPPSSQLSTTTTTSAGVPALASASMTASDRLFGRRVPPPPSDRNKNTLSLGAAGEVSAQDLLVDACRTQPTVNHNAFNSNTPYRYAVVRGSADGKRYLVLGSHGIFDRNLPAGSSGTTTEPSSLTPGDLSANTSETTPGQQIIPLDSFPTLARNSSLVPAHLMEEGIHRHLSTITAPTVVRRSKGSSSLVVTALPAAAIASDSVVVT